MRSFEGITAQNLGESLVSLPASVFNNKYGGVQAPCVVSAVLAWVNYGAASANPNVGVYVRAINTAPGPQQALYTIVSVRIDNTGVAVPVYVVFPDTGFIVVCPPNAVVMENVITGQYDAYVYGLGFTDEIAALGATTQVFFCNFQKTPFSNVEIPTTQDLWLASSQITRGNSIYQQNFGIPALGDQCVGETFDVTAPFSQTFFNFGTGFVYVTQIQLVCCEPITTAADGSGILTFQSTGPSGIFIPFQIALSSAAQSVQNGILLDLNGNYKLDGTQLWEWTWSFLSGSFSSGLVSINMSFTTNPN